MYTLYTPSCILHIDWPDTTIGRQPGQLSPSLSPSPWPSRPIVVRLAVKTHPVTQNTALRPARPRPTADLTGDSSTASLPNTRADHCWLGAADTPRSGRSSCRGGKLTAPLDDVLPVSSPRPKPKDDRADTVNMHTDTRRCRAPVQRMTDLWDEDHQRGSLGVGPRRRLLYPLKKDVTSFAFVAVC